ncbi:MAG: LPS assembly lipoprotein LptE [Candidatus Cloacimonetes bacterium]|jgi:hypothetical protein|nr:LPS assembly lipoprotein LptE [Candidatus Cloacimonadota bacterium]
MKSIKFIKLLLIVLLVNSCSYSVYTTAYPHLKTIKVLPIENQTSSYDLRDIAFYSLIDGYESDGRLKLVGLSPDCQIECSILDYSNKIVTYSGSSIDEYEVRILFEVIFTDLKKNQVLWQNGSLILSERYSLSDENSQFRNEKEAQEEITGKLFDAIMEKTLEEW